MVFFFFSSRRRHTRLTCDWSSDVCSSDLRGHDPARAPTVRLITLAFKLRPPTATVSRVFQSEFYVVQIPNRSRHRRSSGVMPPSQPANYRSPFSVFRHSLPLPVLIGI